MSKKNWQSFQVPVFFMKEGKIFICFAPALDLVAHGDSFDDALASFEETLQLFVEEITRMGSWSQVFAEYGWQKIGKRYIPPEMIGQTFKTLSIPAVA